MFQVIDDSRQNYKRSIGIRFNGTWRTIIDNEALSWSNWDPAEDNTSDTSKPWASMHHETGLWRPITNMGVVYLVCEHRIENSVP